MFKPVSPKVDVPGVELEQLAFWKENRIFQRSMEMREGAPRYVTYEGPPTANGSPAVHHVLARAFKDLFPRYKTMRGYYVLRKGGWDTHGLPVELAMEKELGFTRKSQIEEFGIAEFNERCRAKVVGNIGNWERFTERMAYWTDIENAYITFKDDYIESVWWILKQFWEKGLLYKSWKVVPYCARCGTPLSSHEIAQGYKDVKDPSVFVRFRLRDQPGTAFLVWTTTPWTLPANVALAIGEDIDYVEVEGALPNGEGTERLILAAALKDKALKDPASYTVVREMKGRDLLGTAYEPLFSYLPVSERYAYVIAGDFVSTGDGSGIVHIAPAYGIDDMAVAGANGLPVLQTVGADGRFIDAVTDFKGMWVKDADPEIITDLKRRGLLYKSEKYLHTYPHCWRDDTPLLYMARDSWFIRTTAHREAMIEGNAQINWVPEHVREGRFGNWLTELKDWALGRERYWGTTLPVWIDDQTGESICVGSRAELSQLAGRDLSDLDLHRPYVDAITFPNPNGSGGTMRRVPEVIDVWFDSGAMPVAQWGYPAHNAEKFEEQFPADYICEAVDQTRGWFYTLHSISTMLFDTPAFKNVICLGLLLDGNGQKMSKSKGNVIDPWDIMNTQGADAMRWYLYTSGPPGEPRRFSGELINETLSKVWLTLWNTYSFFVTYANLDGWTPATSSAPPVGEREALDRFVIAELHGLVREVTEAMESYDVPGATRPVSDYIEMLSNWYVRLSRRRFWKSESDADKQSAYATLYECLVTLAKLIAPGMPYLSDVLYRNLVSGMDSSAPVSVHLSDWPDYDAALIDQTLIDEMRLVQRLVSLGRAARETVGIGVRQPLARARFATRSARENDVVRRLAGLIAGELNVKGVDVLDGAGDAVAYRLNPLPSVLGKKFGKDFPRVQKLLREGDAESVRGWAEMLLRGESVVVTIDGQTFEATPAEVEVKREAAAGYAVAEDDGYLAAVETTLTEALKLEGLAREVVRRVQDLRKKADFVVSDTIALRYDASDRLASAIERFGETIAGETLAVSIERGLSGNGGVETFRASFAPDPDGDAKRDTSIDGEMLHLEVRRA